MKKKIVLNFWNALFLFIGMRLISGIIVALIVFLFEVPQKNGSYHIFFDYLEYFLFASFIFLLVKKTNTNIKESLFIPDLSTVIRTFVIMLAAIVVLSPLGKIDLFFESLINSKLRIPGTTSRQLFLWFDILYKVIVPIVEELFFRGIVLKNFLKKYSPIHAILLSSLLFGFQHIGNFIGTHPLSFYNIIFYIISGILFGILYYKTNSLIIVMLAHIFYNASTLFYWDYIDLNMTNLILYLIIYTTAFVLLVFQLKSLKMVRGSGTPYTPVCNEE